MKKKFIVDGMSCSACSAAVERVTSKLDGVTKSEVNLLAKTLVCECGGEVNDDIIIQAVRKAGFTATPVKEKNAAPKRENKTEPQGTPVKQRLIISAVFLLILMYFSMGHMLGLPIPAFFEGTENAVQFAFLQFLLTLPVMYVNRKFYFNGFKALKNRAPNMDTLVAIGSSAAIIYGVVSVFVIGWGAGHGDNELVSRYASNLYFESGAMILTLVTVGKFFEERSKNKTGDVIRKLMKLSPETALVVRGGETVQIPAEDIIVGDILEIKPGARIPVDGVVTEGSSTVDESALTGESLPVEKAEGSTVMSASINNSGYFRMRATKVGADTTLARIIELVEEAGASKAPIARLADKVSGVFVPVVMGIAFITSVIWLLSGKGVEFALTTGISVLVISCPCALGLATPVAITVATGRCAGEGILIKSAQALEVLQNVDTVVVDKTGTVTTGKPAVTDVIPFEIDESELVRLAASVEHSSEHPLASAICGYAGNMELYETNDFSAAPGKGISCTAEGDKIYGGTAAYMRENGISVEPLEGMAKELSDEGKTVMYFGRGDKLIGVIAVSDEIKPDSVAAVKALQENDIEVIMLTGDNRATAEALGKTLGITRTISEVLPVDKGRIISELQAQGKRVAMVGDGINDAIALMGADVGIAIGAGTDIAIDSADIVLMKNSLFDVDKAIRLSRKTIRNIKQNLFWAFFYNSIGIPVAAGALYPMFGLLLSPMIGAAAMSFSSVFVVTNALRLYKTKIK